MPTTRTAIVPALLLLLTDALVAQGWTPLLPASMPSARNGAAMAYDELRNRTVLFGGNGALGDTWEWDGANWSSVAVTGPPPRVMAAMAYDLNRNRVVLFGGESGTTLFGDTWEWNGTAWTNMGSGGPSPRSGHSLVYDQVMQRCLLFGGGSPPSAQTWSYGGTTWSFMTPSTSPPARRNHAMAYDSLRNRGILFGGDSGGAVGLNDTWMWDSTAGNWLQLPQGGTLPTVRLQHAMAYDRVWDRMVVFGGYSGVSSSPCCMLLSDTRVWSGSAWTLQTSGPSARIGHAMAFGPQGRIVMLGGVTPGDTWEFGGTPIASVQSSEMGCGAPRLTTLGGNLPRIGTTFTASIFNVPAGHLAFMGFGWSRMFPPFPLFGAPGCNVYINPFAWNLPTTPSSPTTSQFSLPIPNAPQFLGNRFELQGWALAPTTVNPLGLIVSNVLSAVIGQ